MSRDFTLLPSGGGLDAGALTIRGQTEQTKLQVFVAITLLPTVPRRERCREEQAVPLAAWQPLMTLSSWLFLPTRLPIALSHNIHL